MGGRSTERSSRSFIRCSIEVCPTKTLSAWSPQSLGSGGNERHTTAGKALRGRLVRWLSATPFMEGASDLNLWFVVLLLEGVARAGAKVEDLEAKSPNNASFAAGFGPGSESERFALWTECKPAVSAPARGNTFDPY